MTQLNLEISDDLEQFVEREAAANGYGSSADYVRAVIEAMRSHKDIGELERTIVGRIEGAPAIELTPEVWAGLEARVQKRLSSAGR